jgi:hypothetical protein
MGPVRNPVLLHRVAPCFPWFLSFGNRTQNSRVAGARPNHQPIGGSDPNHQGIWSPPRAGLGPVRNPVLLHRVAPCFSWFLSFGNRTKTPGWLVQDPTTSPSGDLIPTIRGSGAVLYRPPRVGLCVGFVY